MSADRILRETASSTELARGVVRFTEPGLEGRLERLRLKQAPYTGDEEIRFSFWRDEKLIPKPLNLSEDQFLELLGNGISAGVFSKGFLERLRAVIESH